MKRNLVNIKLIPQNIKEEINKHLQDKLMLVGYKKISNKHIVPIIEISNKYRLWVLINEIKSAKKRQAFFINSY